MAGLLADRPDGVTVAEVRDALGTTRKPRPARCSPCSTPAASPAAGATSGSPAPAYPRPAPTASSARPRAWGTETGARRRWGDGRLTGREGAMEDQHGGAGTARPDVPPACRPTLHRGSGAGARPSRRPAPPKPGRPRRVATEPAGPADRGPAPLPPPGDGVAVLAGMAVVFASFGAVFVLIADLQDEIGFPDWGLGLVVAASFGVSFVSQISPVPTGRPGPGARAPAEWPGRHRAGHGGRGRRRASCGSWWLARGVVGLGGGTSLPPPAAWW